MLGAKSGEKKEVLTFTQPVMLQSFKDEFDLPTQAPNTPGETGNTMIKANDVESVSPEYTTYYHKGTGKLLHMMKWSRPEIYNVVRYLSRPMSVLTKDHIVAMHRVMAHCVLTPLRGWKLIPRRKWYGKDNTFEFVIGGRSDSYYSASKDTRRSVSGWSVYLECAPISVKSYM